MKTPFVVMNRSAMARQQKISILANELVRRLSNTNFKKGMVSLPEGWTEKRKKETYKTVDSDKRVSPGPGNRVGAESKNREGEDMDLSE